MNYYIDTVAHEPYTELFSSLVLTETTSQDQVFQKSYSASLARIELERLIKKESSFLEALQGCGAPSLVDYDLPSLQLNVRSQTQFPLASLNLDQFEPDSLVQIALVMARSVAMIHQQDILSLNISPGSFRLSSYFRHAELIDFSAAEYLPKSSNGLRGFRPAFSDPHFLAPEQGLQLTRSVDTRTDLYALGSVYFWMLTGEKPFAELDRDDDISYAHIARGLDLPTRVSRQGESDDFCLLGLISVVEKLLQKEPEGRYQSADALSKDLQALLEASETERAQFLPAHCHISDRLFMPDKLYGREAEKSVILEAFQRVAQGEPEALLIAGYSGVGKSALVGEVQLPILQANGLFIRGKFDQFQGASPYKAIEQAFSKFVHYIMTLSAEQVDFWRARINDALAPNTQVLIDVLPDLEILLGPQSQLSPLGPEEQQNRFNQTFLKFVQTIGTAYKPLVLFIDDIQWADLASIKLLEFLLKDANSRYFLLLGAYRDNEVSAVHPFMTMLTALKGNERKISRIQLSNITQRDLEQWLSDTLKQPLKEVASLARAVYRKTQGNPFFTRQFLFELYQSGALQFSSQEYRWIWSVDEAQQLGITENVVDLMLTRIARLPERSQLLLRQASYLGVEVDPELAEALLQGHDFNEALQPVLQAGLMLQVPGKGNTPADQGCSLHFLHDRVQQAAYSLVSPDERPALHYRIGSLMLSCLDESSRHEHCYDLLGHLNQALALLDVEQRDVVAALNLVAARRAREATAYAQAVSYVEFYLELARDHAPAASLCEAELLRLECLYLAGEYDVAEQRVGQVHALCTAISERVQLHIILITQYTRYGQLERAIAEGVSSLRALGCHFPDQADGHQIERAVASVQEKLQRCSFKQLAEQPEIQDSRVLMTLEVLMAMQPCCYNSGSMLFPLTILTLLDLTLDKGNSAHSSYVFMMYALFCTKVLKAYDTAFEAEYYSRQVARRFPPTPLVAGRLSMMRANFILPWQKALVVSGGERERAYHACLEQGDYYWGVHAYIFGFYADLLSSSHLDSLLDRTRNVIKTCRQIQQPAQVYLSQLQCNLIRILQGDLDNQHNLDHVPGYEQEAKVFFNDTHYMCGKYDRILGRLIQGYLFGNYRQALEESLSKQLTAADLDEGIFHEAMYTLFNILSILAVKQSRASLPDHWREWLTLALDKLACWVELNPDNFAAANALVQAEQAMIEGEWIEAVGQYEAAIEGAEQSGLLLFQALASERLGYQRAIRGQLRQASACLQDSIHLYQAWGAQAKVAQLQDQLQVFSDTETTVGSVDIKWRTVVEASQQMSRPLNTQLLDAQLLEWVSKMTGAQLARVYRLDGEHWVLACQVLEGQAIDIDVPPERFPEAVLNYCRNSQTTLLLSDACYEETYVLDPYIAERGCRSLLGVPLVYNHRLTGVLVLEHRRTAGLFTGSQARVVELLATQYMISYSNSCLYQSLQETNAALEQKVEARTLELKRKSNHLESILNALPLPYVLTRMDGTVIAANRLFCSQFGLNPQNLQAANSLHFYASVHDRQCILELLRRTGEVTDFECQLKSAEGQVFWAHFTSTVIQLENEKAIFSTISDISRQKAKESELHHQANTDPLTGVLNRRAFFHQAVELCKHGQDAAVAMLDLDHFKRLNDTFSHAAGDLVLKEFSQLVTGLLREADRFGRIGGEEFVVLLVGVSAQHAMEVLERIRQCLESHSFVFKESLMRVTASIGVTEWDGQEPLEQALERADSALYLAKERGRNRCLCH